MIVKFFFFFFVPGCVWVLFPHACTPSRYFALKYYGFFLVHGLGSGISGVWSM